MRECDSILVYPQDKDAFYIFYVEHLLQFKQVFLFGTNDDARKEFIELYRSCVGEDMLFWDKSKIVDMIGKELIVTGSMFNDLNELEAAYIKSLIVKIDPHVLATARGENESSRSRFVNSFCVAADPYNLRACIFFDLKPTQILNLPKEERGAIASFNANYHWPKKSEIKKYGSVFYAFKSEDSMKPVLYEEDKSYITTTVSCINRR